MHSLLKLFGKCVDLFGVNMVDSYVRPQTNCIVPSMVCSELFISINKMCACGGGGDALFVDTLSKLHGYGGHLRWSRAHGRLV